jgi:hypothetical protein
MQFFYAILLFAVANFMKKLINLRKKAQLTEAVFFGCDEEEE